MKRFLLAALMMVGALASGAKADILGGLDWDASGAAVLTVAPTAPGQQVTNLPCLICGANQPQQPADFGYNLFGNTGNLTTVPFFSTSVVGGSLAPDTFGGVTSGYSITAGSPFLQALAGNLTFSVGVDSNQAGSDTQVLESFWFLNFTQQTVLAVFSPGPGGYDIDPLNNGTGFPDYTISGFSLAGINAGDRIGFFARITNANDGPDSFFLLPFAVPGPAVGAGLPALMTAAFALLGFHRLRRRRFAA
jgi:hypothetical protein